MVAAKFIHKKDYDGPVERQEEPRVDIFLTSSKQKKKPLLHEKSKRSSMEDDAVMILKDVFGESSDSEEPQEYELDYASRRGSSELVCERSHSWEQISQIDGLWLCRNFLSSDQQASLLSSINRGEEQSIPLCFCIFFDL